MADYRTVKTKFWSDGFISALHPLDRYFFLYLLTNEHTDISGVYELPMRVAAFESGLKVPDIERILGRLAGKIAYIDGWVAIKNFQKNQALDNPKIKKGIENSLKQVPEAIREAIKKAFASDSLSIGYTYPSNKRDREIGSRDRKRESGAQDAPTPSPANIARGFFDGGKEFSDIRDYLCSKLPAGLVDSELKKFVSYWTEPNKSGTRVRWEQQQTFEVKRRIATWFNNIKSTGSAGRSTGRGLA